MADSRGQPRADTKLIAAVIEQCRPFLAYHAKVERAPRWTCPECQFESNAHYASHHHDCSHREAAS